MFPAPLVVTRTWQDIYRDHVEFVWRMLRRLGLSASDAEDALHEVFLVAHLKYEAYDAERGSERAWLMGIACNVARSERRRAQRAGIPMEEPHSRRSLVSGGEALGQGPLHSSHGSDGPERNELKRALASAIDKLSPEHRIVFEMFELEGTPCAAVAEELGIPVGTVYSRLHKAREDLKRALKGHFVQRGVAR